ncbi:Protein FAM49B [Myotis davidii]|uniref:Protein FAM49B n=1 Tax=Myotis davidii TaxID=225400 RepID=L5MIK9_MYODS|nr:Protein FAM49B [Myotis davidii]
MEVAISLLLNPHVEDVWQSVLCAYRPAKPGGLTFQGRVANLSDLTDHQWSADHWLATAGIEDRRIDHVNSVMVEGRGQNHQHWLKTCRRPPARKSEFLSRCFTSVETNMQHAQPTESEKEIYNQVNVVLKDAEGILEDLQSYRGAGHEIREAIQHPADEKLQEKAWGAVVPLVGKLKKFYEFSQRLEAALRGLLGALTSTPYSPTQHLEREQALAKQFAEILHFTLRFDELKMTNPAIQNDFSYYRRTLSRMRINNVPAEGENEVNNELANRMSLFYAEATPMLKTLSDATTKFVSENKNLPIENTTDCLSTMASVCRVMLETPEYRSRFTNEETVSFCLRVMVGVIILYDHVHPVGAFAKTSKIDVFSNSLQWVFLPVRYTTKHLNDETTSKQIKSMLQ